MDYAPIEKEEQTKTQVLSYFFCRIPTCVNIFLRTGNPTFTKSFHIPGLRLPPTTKAETIVAPAAPRVKAYLPPPLNFVDVKRPTSNKDSGCNSNEIELSMRETEDRKHVSPPSSPISFYTDAYPSPSTSSSKPSLSFIPQAKRARNYTPPRSRPGVRVVTSYRPPSPPTSDLPIPSDADIHVEVDHEGIQHRYAEMKRLSRKVLCSIFFFFSCFFLFFWGKFIFECDILIRYFV